MDTLNKTDAAKLSQMLIQLTFQLQDNNGGVSVETRVAWKALRNAQKAISHLLHNNKPNGYSLVRCDESGQWVARFFAAPGKWPGRHSEYALTDLCSRFLDEWKANGATRWPHIERAIRAQLLRSDLSGIPLPPVDPPSSGECAGCGDVADFACDDAHTRGLEGGYCDL